MTNDVHAEGLPALRDGGHVIVASAYFPPQVTGSSVVMRNLLSRFDPSSYTVVTAKPRHGDVLDHSAGVGEVFQIASSIGLSYRLNEWWREAQIPLMRRRIEALVRQRKAELVVGVYPDYHFMLAALDASRRCGVPFVAYLHDTMAEAMEGTALENETRMLQERVLAEAARVLVMSEGLSELYERKYGLSTVPILHTYPEPIPETPVEGPQLRQGFWGGSLYRINLNGVRRVSDGFAQLRVPFVMTMSPSRARLKEFGIEGSHLELAFYSTREAYLEALRRQGVLVQALDWPDESGTHEDELSTIFPTKTPEYLAAGVPILVHCPEHYYLARFVRKHGCGVVVGERETERIVSELRAILDDGSSTTKMRQAAVRTAGLFGVNRVASTFATALQGI
jgi:hypothetical protein